MALVSGREIFSESEWTELVKELSLSPRQAQVLKCLFLGHSDKQIARDLKMAIPTVRTHLSRLFSRFDVQDRTELVLYVFRRFHNEYTHL
jgi:DNA-binding NarL/FixJ family response regulator